MCLDRRHPFEHITYGRDDQKKLCCIVLSFPECIASLRYINYKKFRRDKISDKCFDENFFDEISNGTKVGHVQIFCFKNFENSYRQAIQGQR